LLRFCGTSLPSTSRLVPGLPTRCKRQTNSRVHSVRMGGTQGGGWGCKGLRPAYCPLCTVHDSKR
jgi:hypothetical protein